MPQPASQTNSNGRDLDVVLDTGGTVRFQRGINNKAVTGQTAGSLAHEVGTHVDDAAFGVAVDTIVAVGFLADETATDSVDEGDVGVARMTLDRRTLIASQDLVDNAAGATDRVFPVGVVRDDALATLTPADGDYTNLRVDSTGALWVRAGTGAGDLGKAEDAAHTTGDAGVMALAVRDDANAVLAGTDLDYIPLTTDAAGGLRVAGSVAHDAVDAGNPLKIGGKASAAAPGQVGIGDRVDAWFQQNGLQAVFVGDSSGNLISTITNTWPDNTTQFTGQTLMALGVLYNGAGWDKARNNIDATILASAARTATTASADQTNFNGRGLHLVFDITAVPGADTVTLTIQGKDALSGAYYTILAGAAQVGTGTIVMRVYPALTAAANLTASDVLPRTWRVNVVHSGAGSFTYRVGASVIL